MAVERGYEYNGLALGKDTEYGVTNVVGLYDSETGGYDTPKSQEHGAEVSARFLRSKRIVMEGNLHDMDDEDFAASRAAFGAAFIPQSTTKPLEFFLPGESERFVYCVPRKKTFPIDVEFVQSNIARWAVEFIAGDPRVYSVEEKILDDDGVAENEGNISSPPVFHALGPGVNPRVELGTGEFIQVNIVLDAGEELVIDVLSKMLLLEGVRVPVSNLADGYTWFELLPGENDIAWDNVDSGGTLWRDTWI